MPKKRDVDGTQRWAQTPMRGKMLRHCPKCGAPPYRRCVREVSGFYTQQATGADGGYTVNLKHCHKER